jgi:polar amino acid transport system permease protein
MISDDVIAKPLRHPARTFASILILVIFAIFLWSLWSAPGIDHKVIGKYLFDPQIIDGIKLTLILTVIAMVIGITLAIGLAVMKLSSNPLLKTVSTFFIWFFRGTPLLIQIVFWGYLGLIYPNVTISIPFTEIVFFTSPTSNILSAFTAGVIALSLNEAAYAAEIVRAGLISIDVGQSEAAKSLGMRNRFILQKIVLPQAMRVIVPPMGNETISMLKNTSLLAVIAVMELYTRASQISSQNLAQVELLVVAAFWYLVMTTVLAVPQAYLEKKYGRGFASTTESHMRLFRGARSDKK